MATGSFHNYHMLDSLKLLWKYFVCIPGGAGVIS